jgi:hypothetical protein
MIKYENMRNELRYYLRETVDLWGSIDYESVDGAVYKNAWYDQKYAIDFVVEDLNIIDDGPPCVGVLLYNLREVEVVRQLGLKFLEFYRIGESNGYKAAFHSDAWRDVHMLAKSALELILLNDARPPN